MLSSLKEDAQHKKEELREIFAERFTVQEKIEAILEVELQGFALVALTSDGERSIVSAILPAGGYESVMMARATTAVTSKLLSDR